MLGHKSATVTLDQYGHLFGDDLDTIADRLDVQARTARTSCGLFADCGRVDQAAVGRSGSYSPVNTGLSAWCPRQDSNLRSRLRRAIFGVFKIVGKCL